MAGLHHICMRRAEDIERSWVIAEMERRKRASLSEKALHRSEQLVEGSRELIKRAKAAKERAAEIQKRARERSDRRSRKAA